MSEELCSDCPPVGYPTDGTRCLPCPRRASAMTHETMPGAERAKRTSEHIPTQEGRGGEAEVDAIISALYLRFKDWSKRGFGPDDVTWCEVKADVMALLLLSSPRVEEVRREAFSTAWDRVTASETPTMKALRKKLSIHDLRMILLVALDMPVIEHEWFCLDGRPYECCKNCGIVRRSDGLNSACKGRVKVGLRSLSPPVG